MGQKVKFRWMFCEIKTLTLSVYSGNFKRTDGTSSFSFKKLLTVCGDHVPDTGTL